MYNYRIKQIFSNEEDTHESKQQEIEEVDDLDYRDYDYDEDDLDYDEDEEDDFSDDPVEHCLCTMKETCHVCHGGFINDGPIIGHFRDY